MRNCKPVCVSCGHELIVTDQVEKKFHLCLQHCLRGSAFERPFHRPYRCTTRVSDIQIKKYSRFFWAHAAVETIKERGPPIGNDAQSRPAIGIDCLSPRSYQRKRARFVSDVTRELAQIAKQGDAVDFLSGACLCTLVLGHRKETA